MKQRLLSYVSWLYGSGPKVYLEDPEYRLLLAIVLKGTKVSLPSLENLTVAVQKIEDYFKTHNS